MSRAKKKDPVVPVETSARPAAGPALKGFGGLSKGRTVGFSSSDGAGPPLATLPPVAAAAAARTAAAPQGPEVAPTTSTDDVTKMKFAPAAPSPAAAAPPAPPVQPPATAPSAPQFSATSHQWAIPGVSDARTDATNAWADRVDQRSEYQRRRLSEQIPQGETQLVHVWFSVLAQGVPPQACTIWLTRSEPEPPYTIMIAGEAVAGQQPDRALFLHAGRNRRQAGVPETFTGRIRAPTVDGKVIELGGGMLYLPPDPAVAASQQPPGASPWMMAPGSQWTPGHGGQQPPWGTPPWMAGMPPWMQGMPPWMMGMPPWMMPGGSAPPWWQHGGGMPIPDAIKGKPELVALFEVMQKMQHQPQDPNQALLMSKIIEQAFKDKPAPEKPPGLLDQVEGIGKLVTALDAIRGKDNDGGGGAISVTYVDDGAGGRTPIVSKNGEIDMSTTVGIPAVGALRSIGKTIGTRMGMGGGAGNVARGKSPQPAQVPSGTNGAAGGNGKP